MSSAAVTIVVPGFDVAAYAEEALASLHAQTREDWRAVLVDDGSTDATGEIFARAAADDPRMRLIAHDRRRGLAAARNTGIDAVETPLVGFLDADDVMRPRALEHLVGALEASGSDFALGAYVRLLPDDDGYRAGEVQPWVRASTEPARSRTSLAEHPDACGNIVAWSKVVRISAWRRMNLRFPEGRLYEDQVVAQRLYTGAHAFDVVPDVVMEWRERADGTSITQSKNRLPVLREYLAGLRGGVAVLEAHGASEALRARVALLLTLDVPALIDIARDHPDPQYRRELGAFLREMLPRVPASSPSATLAAASLW